MARLSPENWEDIRAAREAGETFAALAEKFGVSAPAIHKRAQREGWGDGRDIGAEIRRRVNTKVNAINPKKKAAALDAAATVAAAVVERHRQQWQAHTDRFGIPEDFEEGKLAKITAEMLTIRQKGERAAYSLDEPQTAAAVPAVPPVIRVVGG